MKVGGSLGSDGILSSVLILPQGKKFQNFNAQGCHERASDRMQRYRST